MIPPLSKKRARQNQEYLKLRAVFLEDTCCRVCLDMAKAGELSWEDIEKATDAHHMKGRTGVLLTDERYFLAVCRKHHKQIEMNPKWAKEKGYSLSRLGK